MLEHLFFPESVAVIGASRQPGKVGHDILANLVKGGFSGAIIPINPSGGTLFDLKVYPSLREYPGTVDQAIVAVPKPHVLATVRDALAKGAGNIIMITAGFKETGSEGAELEAELTDLCRRNGARLVGPNCLACSTPKTTSTVPSPAPCPGRDGSACSRSPGPSAPRSSTSPKAATSGCRS